MSTGLAVFDETVQESNGWLKQLQAELDPCSREQTYRGLRTVLHVLRDRLPETAVLSLSAQLPMLLRGLFLEGWRPQAGSSHVNSIEAFSEAVQERLGDGFPRDAVAVSTAVLHVISNRLDPGEVDKLIRYLPAHLRTLWPEDYWIA
jgi:uncharacterized protein (DUF2267 family)